MYVNKYKLLAKICFVLFVCFALVDIFTATNFLCEKHKTYNYMLNAYLIYGAILKQCKIRLVFTKDVSVVEVL